MSEDSGEAERSFEERLRSARGRQGLDAPPSAPGQDPGAIGGSAMSIGLRVGVELVSAQLVAVAIGYGLDWLFGTKPILILVFFLLGGAAGILNVWRVVSARDAAKD